MTAQPGTTVVIYHHGFRYRTVADRHGVFHCPCCGTELSWIVW